MIYRFWARAAFWLHWAICFWGIAGVPAAVFFPSYARIHAILVGILLLSQQASRGRCPLTVFEKKMWAKGAAPERVYSGAFLHHYPKKIFGRGIPAKTAQITALLIFAASAILAAADVILS